jgi:hypothetical protein
LLCEKYTYKRYTRILIRGNGVVDYYGEYVFW